MNNLTLITLEAKDAFNAANAITVVNTTDIDYSLEGEAGTLYIVLEDLTENQKERVTEALEINNIKYLS